MIAVQKRLFMVSLMLVTGVVHADEETAKELPWAFHPLRRPAIPAVKNVEWVRNPIDAFILARLEKENLKPAPEADRRTWIRRVYFDLIGLPPTPEEVDRFVNDPAADAYERVVDRLLASPRYGERWAMYWLDLVRYAETDGFKADFLRPSAWRYRDYVIRSFNHDKPYDRFIREQLAGDELYPDDAEAQVATGFLRHYPDEYNAVNLEQRRQEILNDITDTSGLVFLGLTLGCAQCHDHKYDPITQEDYYRFQAFFAAFWPVEKSLSPLSAEEHQRQLAQWREQTTEIREQMAKLEEPYRQKLAAKKLFRFPREYQEMYKMPAEKRSPLQKQIAAMVALQVEADAAEVVKMMKGEVRQQWEALAKKLAKFDHLKPKAPTALAMTDLGPEAPPTHLLRRGNWRRPSQEVEPGYLSAIKIEEPAIESNGRTTGRRSALARWLTQPDHPLTSRVMMNRLWHHHFGQGIITSPSDFGAQGGEPSHPELLDWLACEFVARGWKLKTMHKLIVTSATYRQGNQLHSQAFAIDSQNRLLWRMNRRRLEGETLRDAMLAVSGLLNDKMYGPGIRPDVPDELRGKWQPTPNAAERQRRSVYVFAKRNLPFPLFQAFDAPDRNHSCACRNISTNAPQALMLLNSKTVLGYAEAFARRVEKEASSDTGRIERTFLLALGRRPDQHEMRLCRQFFQGEKEPEAAIRHLCHVVLNLNEFLNID
ncbi:MAG: hypothetical protein KatS3mg105_1905 [Gemmatales bacterium]|nr:MAG: hypothetical protein KatS3mg105_1905 [Gemmatales bacterium]